MDTCSPGKLSKMCRAVNQTTAAMHVTYPYLIVSLAGADEGHLPLPAPDIAGRVWFTAQHT